MESITKLQGKLREAEDILQYVSKELEHFAEDKTVGTELNFSKIKLRGEQYSFYEHPLKKQIFQDEYFALMIYIISLGDKKEEGWTLLYRIVAGCGYQKDLQNLTTDAMTLTEERLSEIIRMIYSAEMARTFALDSLMICYHMGADDAQLQFLSDLYELLKLDKNFLTEAVQFVKVFDATFWDNLAEKSRAWKFLTARDLATYIGAYPAASLEEAAKLNYKRLVISGITYTSNDVLKLDDWKSQEILFLNCRFENCGGIYSENKVVKFAECTFDGNIVRYADSHERSYTTSYCWTDKKYSYSRGFLNLNNANFVRCIFKNFSDSVPMMYLNGSAIYECEFEKIKQSPSPSVIFNINNSEVTKTKFIDCVNIMPFRNNACVNSIHEISCDYYHTGCLIHSANTRWRENLFINCRNSTEGDRYARGSSHIMILDKNSSCTGCTFENNVATFTYDTYSGKAKQDCALLGLRDSAAYDNKNGTVSNLERISLTIFQVGDKLYDNFYNRIHSDFRVDSNLYNG